MPIIRTLCSPVRACASLYKRICRFARLRKLAFLAILTLFGLILALNTAVHPAVWLSLSAAFFALFFAFRKKKNAGILVFLSIALAFSGYGAYRNLPNENLFEGDFTVTGVIDRAPAYQADKNRTVTVLNDAYTEEREIDGKVYVYLYGFNEEVPLSYGQEIRISEADVFIPDTQTNPYGFDFQKYLKRKGISLCLSASAWDAEVLGQKATFQTRLNGVRDEIGKWIDDMYPGNADVMRALLIGDKESISEDTYDDFRDSGIAHIIALSGLHVSCIAMMVEAVLRLFMIPKRARYLITVMLLSVYALMTGMTPSIMRAVIMYACLCLARSFGYPSDLLTRLSYAFLIQVSINPLVIGDTGFQLSYASILSIALLTEPFTDALNGLKEGGLLKKCASLCMASVAIQIGTLPLMSSLFYQVPVLSIPVNLIAVPLGLASVYLGAFSALLYSIFPPLGRMLACIPDGIWSLIRIGVGWIAELPFAVLSSRVWPFAAIFGYFICLFMVSPYPVPGKRERRGFVLLMIAFLLIGMVLPIGRSTGLRVTFLEAGYADSAVIDAKGKVYVVDCGRDNDICADYLTASGAKVEAVFVTHPDTDHAGGLIEILKRYEDADVYLPECWKRMDVSDALDEALKGEDVTYLSAGDEIKLADRIYADVLWPQEDFAPKSDNDGSLVLSIRYNDERALFMGDLTDEYDHMIMSDCGILKVSHHGSKYATTEEFLSFATPEIAVISVSGNGYGHPTEEVLARLRKVGAEVYRTDECGAVIIDVDMAGDISIRTFLPAKG